MSDLMELRQKIDSLDATLVNTLNERARISLDIGVAKRNQSDNNGTVNEDIQVYRPSREKEVFSKIANLNAGPLKDDSLHAIFREIMSASISLQKQVSISYLGPPGTFTHLAARQRFGESITYVPEKQVRDVFDSVEKGITTYGVVPFENSIFGTVVETLDCFISTTVKVRAETYLPVRQCLLSNSKLEEITKVYSHPQGFGETQKWLSANIPNAERISVHSTSEAAEKAAKETSSAAVCSELCSKLYGLEIVEANIDDKADNMTRFLIIGGESDTPTDDDRTLLLFIVDHRQPGGLCNGLKVFKDFDINLFKINSRPSGQRPWHDVFFVECSGHFDSEQMQKAVKELQNFCLDIVILGSFPDQRSIYVRVRQSETETKGHYHVVEVYDTYQPVVDYTNLLVVGITGALAWELPSKPVHPDEELHEIHKNGSLSLLRRSDSDDVEINNVQKENTTGSSFLDWDNITISAKPTTYGMDKFLQYLSYSQSAKEVKTMTNFYNELTNGKIPASDEIHRHSNSHPTFRKRSISENTKQTSEDMFYRKHHRTSRYNLYEHLVKFIDTTGHDGRDCILKALCETGQTKRNEKHRSFLGEMMRVIFSLPDFELIQENLSKGLYEAAFTESRNCTTEYPKCSQLWKSPFH